MTPAEVPSELVEIACRARWDATGSEFRSHNGDVAHTWDALAALFPTQADVHRRRERAALAAVLPLYEADLLEALRLIDGEMDEADDFDGLNADAVQRIGWYIDSVRARLRAAETERTS